MPVSSRELKPLISQVGVTLPDLEQPELWGLSPAAGRGAWPPPGPRVRGPAHMCRSHSLQHPGPDRGPAPSGAEGLEGLGDQVAPQHVFSPRDTGGVSVPLHRWSHTQVIPLTFSPLTSSLPMLMLTHDFYLPFGWGGSSKNNLKPTEKLQEQYKELQQLLRQIPQPVFRICSTVLFPPFRPDAPSQLNFPVSTFEKQGSPPSPSSTPSQEINTSAALSQRHRALSGFSNSPSSNP